MEPFPSEWPARPRLMATPQRIADLKEAIQRSPAGQALKAEIIRKAGKALGEPPLLDYGDPLRTTRKTLRRVQYLGLAWLLDGDRRYAERARQELQAICQLPDWTPSHFLCAAEMTHAAAIGYDWFYGELDDGERAACVAAIVQKGLKPGAESLASTQKAWPNQVNNWNIVCNGGLMIGALAVAETEAEWSRKVFLRCLDSVPTGFRGYSPDGSWSEGPGYWSYATEYAAYLLSSLRSAIGHDFGLAGLPGFRDTGFFLLHAEGSASGTDTKWKLFNYSDSEEERTGSWALRWLYLRFKKHDPRYALYNLIALRDAQSTPMDLLWFSSDEPKDAAPADIPRNAVFRGLANVAMLRGGWGEKATFRPSSADSRGDVYLGGFVLDAQNVRWAIDLAPVDAETADCAADYQLPGYFDIDLERRFRYYRTGTIGHNTLLVNGFNQALGVDTEIIAFGEKPPAVALVVMDLTAAYPDCLRVRRGFALIEGREVLIVDELTPKQPVNVVWQMHTRAQARSGRVAELTQDAKRFYVRILEPQSTEFVVQAAEVRQPREAPNKDVRRLVATLPNVALSARLAIHLSASATPPAKLPDPLGGPLWSWIAWAEDIAHRAPKGESYAGRRDKRGYAAQRRRPT